MEWNPELEDLTSAQYAHIWESFTQNYPEASRLTNQNERLGAYYAYRQTAGATSLPEFVFGLAQRLLEYQAAESSEFAAWSGSRSFSENSFSPFSADRNAPVAISASEFCSSTVGQLFSAAPSFFGGTAEAVYSAISGLGGFSCSGDGQLDDVLSRINDLQNSLDNLQDGLGNLTNFVAGAQVDTNIQDFEVLTSDLEQLSQNYSVILSNEGVSSLKEYVVLKGGVGPDALAITLRNEPDSIFADLVSRIGSTSSKSYILQVSNLTGPKFNSLVNGLDLLCAAPSKGDISQTRAQCNMVIGTTVARLVAMHQMAETLAGATYELFDAYPSEATRYGYDRRTTAAQKRADLRAKFSRQATQMVETYRAKVKSAAGAPPYYALFSGLPEPLASNLKSVACFDFGSNSPRLLGWYKDNSNEYLTTNCTHRLSPVLGRYWLKINGTSVAGSADPANILGVLIPQADRSPDNRSGSTVATFGTISAIGMKRSRIAVPGTFLTNDENKKQTGSKIVEEAFISGPPQNLRPDFSVYPWSNDFLTAPHLTLHRTSYDPSKPVQGGIWSWIRFTDQSGFSFVFYFHYAYRNLLQPALAQTSLHCVTVDCSCPKIGSNCNDGTGLNFKDGPQGISLDTDVQKGAVNQAQAANFGSQYSTRGWSVNGVLIDAK